MPRKKKLTNEAIRKKEETILKRQEAQKAKFLTKIQEMPFVSATAPASGIDRSTYYRWRKEDAQFAREVDRVQMIGREKYNDVIESVLLKKAQGGDITSIIFWLKHNHQLYTNRLLIKHEDTILSEERKTQIAKLIKAWSGIERSKSKSFFVKSGGGGTK